MTVNYADSEERDFIKIYHKQQLFYDLDCGIQGFVGGRGVGPGGRRVRSNALV